jgi:outer membrane protein assembly factor BamB
MFRADPAHTGVYDDDGDISNGQLRWTFTTGTAVYSSPTLADGFVYVWSCDGKIYALDASTGAKIWDFTTTPYVTSSPAVSDGVVYVGSNDHKVYALNAATGAKIWAYTTGFWVTSSPAVSNGVVYVGSSDQKVYALGSGSPVTPEEVTNLHNTTYQPTTITWTWTDPLSTIFSKVMVYLNGVFKSNVSKGTQTYTVSDLTPSRSYTLSTRTVSTTGYISPTWVNHTAMTAPRSPSMGVLSLCTIPSGADVFIDGDLYVTTVKTQFFSVPEGCHSLTLKKSGYENWTGNFCVKYPVIRNMGAIQLKKVKGQKTPDANIS